MPFSRHDTEQATPSPLPVATQPDDCRRLSRVTHWTATASAVGFITPSLSLPPAACPATPGYLNVNVNFGKQGEE